MGPGPLAGLRVAVTRPADAGAGFAGLLAAAGATPLILPLSRIIPPRDERPLRAALAQLTTYDWIVFTSGTAVRAISSAVQGLPVSVRIAAVGPATAAAVKDSFGRIADAVPESYSGDRLPASMVEHAVVRGTRVLWPRAAGARKSLITGLQDLGAVIDAPIAYRTVPDPAVARELAGHVAAGAVDILTFTAPSAVSSYARASGRKGSALVASIGPVTTAAARRAGLAVDIQADTHTVTGLVEALVTGIEGWRGRPDGPVGIEGW